MHRIGQKTTLQERVTIGKQATAGRTDTQIATKLDCSVWTVRKWRRIFVDQGRAGFKNHMGRPATGPLGTIPLELQTAIRRLREAHPGWGPDTILISLRADTTREAAALTQPLTDRSVPQAHWTDTSLPEAF